MTLRWSAGAGLALLFVAGCSTLPDGRSERPPAPRANLSGFSANYKQGHADGCDSVTAGKRRDEQRYKADADYMMGWNDGSAFCRRRQ